MENKAAEEILKSKGITSQTKHHNYEYLYKSIVFCMEAYASEEREKGVIEGFNAARETKMELVYERIKGEIELTGEIELLKYQDLNDYLNSKNKP